MISNDMSYAYIVNSCKSKAETTWNSDAESNLAVLTIAGNGDSWASFRIEVTESNSDGSVVGCTTMSMIY